MFNGERMLLQTEILPPRGNPKDSKEDIWGMQIARGLWQYSPLWKLPHAHLSPGSCTNYGHCWADCSTLPHQIKDILPGLSSSGKVLRPDSGSQRMILSYVVPEDIMLSYVSVKVLQPLPPISPLKPGEPGATTYGKSL